MVVTTVSVRLAIKRICQATCGEYPRVVPVVALGGTANRVFALVVPYEFRAVVYAYLAQQLEFPVSGCEDPLMFSEEQARILVERTLIRLGTAA
jgi:hypothetical protein